MKRKPKALSVIWEPVNDAHCAEKLRQALNIVFSENKPTHSTSFDETTNIHQDEGEAANQRGSNKGRISNAN
jgi:hypothetical protein